jgi:hypothetical protein
MCTVYLSLARQFTVETGEMTHLFRKACGGTCGFMYDDSAGWSTSFVPSDEIIIPPSEVEVAMVKLKRYKSPSVDQIPVEQIQAGG